MGDVDVAEMVHSLRRDINELLNGPIGRYRGLLRITMKDRDGKPIKVDLEAAIRFLEQISARISRDPYLKTMLINDIIDISRYVSVLKELNEFLRRLEEIKRILRGRPINQTTLSEIEGELEGIEALLNSILKSKNGIDNIVMHYRDWLKDKQIIESTLNKIESTLKRLGSDIEVVSGRLIVYGRDIGFYILNRLADAKYRIIIFTQTIHNARIRISKGNYIELFDILEAKARSGVKVWVASITPHNAPFMIKNYLEALSRIYRNRLFKHIFCKYMHMKVVVVDDEVILGSANITYKGLQGRGEVAVIIRNLTYANYFESIYTKFESKKHEVCFDCPALNELYACGSLYNILKPSIKILIQKRRAKGISKDVAELERIYSSL